MTISSFRQVLADMSVELDNDIDTLRGTALEGNWEKAMEQVADLRVTIQLMWRLDDKVRDEEDAEVVL